MVCQLVIDIAGELSARHDLAFDDTAAVRNLRRIPGFAEETIAVLEKLPGFRNVLLHDYVAFDPERAVAALRELDPIDDFVRTVAGMEGSGP